MKMTPRLRNFVKNPASFSWRKRKNICTDEELDNEFMLKYKDYLDWSILLRKYKFQFTPEEIEILVPFCKQKKLLWDLAVFQTFTEEQCGRFIEEKIYSSHLIFTVQKVSEAFVEKYVSTNVLADVLENQTLSEDFIRKHAKEFDNIFYHGDVCWETITKHQKLSEQFMRDFNHKLDWRYLPVYQEMSEAFIKAYADKFWWGDFPYEKLSEDFISEMADKVSWAEVSKRKKNMSREFIEKWAHRLDWFNLCYFNKVDSDLLSKYAYKLTFNWNVLCDRQNLSETFIREWKDKLDFGKLLERHLLSNDFIREMKKVIGYTNMRWVTNTTYLDANRNYDAEFKKEMRSSK